jgi:predicted Zn-dependent protease
MSALPEGNPRLPEHINHSEAHPLREFFKLLVAVVFALTALAFAISLLAQWLAPHIPFRWEASAAFIVDDAIAQEFGKTAYEAEQQQALAALGQRLLRADRAAAAAAGHAEGLDIPDEAFTFQLVESDVANAFASLGARIFVTGSLIGSVSSENALAMVLAHEIAHVRYRHPIRSSSSALVLQVAMSAILDDASQAMLEGLLSGTGYLTAMSFSRKMELQADERALETLVKHYGHSFGADEFFRTISDAGADSRWLEFTQTHPNTERRLQVIDRSIRDTVPDPSSAPALVPLPIPLRLSPDR